MSPFIQRTYRGDDISPELEPLLLDVYKEIQRQSPHVPAVCAALEGLLRFIGSPEGLTEPNLRATSMFFAIDDDWGTPLDELPEIPREGTLGGILWDLQGTVTYTITSPSVAANFDSTPELLLARVHEVEAAALGT